MDFPTIGKLEEGDFDRIIEDCGGTRLSSDHGREKRKNIDYVLGNAIVELKLVDEEGLEGPEKEDRRRKLAGIFRTQYPDRPVIVLRPDLLDVHGRRAYYGAMAGPIKGHVKEANKQLKQSASEVGGEPARVLLLINNGYGALSHNEFKDIAIRRACNDTHNIDAIVVGGLYFYSDTFDSYFLPELDVFPIRIDRRFRSYDALRHRWDLFGMNLLTNSMLGQDTRQEKRFPVRELTYELDGVTFVKPAPPMGKPSDFFVKGRPRSNSTGMTRCPPVARSFPSFDAATWQRFRMYRCGDSISWNKFFKATYTEWVGFRQQEENALATTTKPFVPITVDFDAWMTWCRKRRCRRDVRSLCRYANSVFQTSILRVLEGRRARGDSAVVLPRYVLLVTEEIGQDKANDLCSVYLVSETVEREHRHQLVRNERMFFEHGLALTAAYAIKLGLDTLLYEKDLTNAWV